MVQIYRPVKEVARWTSNSQLGHVANDLAAAGRSELGLRELDISRQPLDPAPAVETVDAAVAAVRAARTWLWLHPKQVTGVHFRVGTQLGSALQLLTAGERAEAIGGWRQAAIAASDLRAVVASGPARDAANELGQVLGWVLTLLDLGAYHRAPRAATGFARLVSELRLLAATLHRGLRAAVQRQNLFVRHGVLQRSAGLLVYRSEPRWRPARATDDLVRDLSRGLGDVFGASAQDDQVSVAARLLARPARPESENPTVSVAHRSLQPAVLPPGTANSEVGPAGDDPPIRRATDPERAASHGASEESVWPFIG
ncbi:hypothetical protein [Micromonospora profundi]|uniref:hypothetical protein n=1 Tax=Micromonospora profundi TaxID=1420889 RepID=UPI00364D5389